MYRIGKVSLIMAVLVVLLAAGAFSQAPNTLTYQGKLTDATGPISSAVNVTFRIYDLATGGTLLWSETHSGLTPNESGVFTVQLGSVVSFEPDDFDGSVRYLGIEVAGDGEMVPRQPITSVPYSLGSPGVAYGYVDDYAVAETVTAPISVTVEVDRPGYLLLNGTGFGILAATSTLAAWMGVAIGTDPTLMESTTLHMLWEVPNPNAYAGLESFSTQHLVAVAPGLHTYYMTVSKIGTTDCTLQNAVLSATFIPTWIGTGVPPSLTTSQMSPEQFEQLKAKLTDNLNQEKQ